MEVKGKLFEVVSKMDNTLTPSVNYYGDKVKIYWECFTTKNSYIQSLKSCKYLCSFWNNHFSQHKQLSYIRKCTIWSCQTPKS